MSMPVDEVRIQAMGDDHEGVVLAVMTYIPQRWASTLRQVAWNQSVTSDEERNWKLR